MQRLEDTRQRRATKQRDMTVLADVDTLPQAAGHREAQAMYKRVMSIAETLRLAEQTLKSREAAPKHR